MRIETGRLVIRDLERKDQNQLYKIVWQKHKRIQLMYMNVNDMPSHLKMRIFSSQL